MTAPFNPFARPSGRISGDTFPLFHGGLCHLFHMMPPVLAHHVSPDLVHWEERPVVVEPGGPGDPDSGNVATGCVVEHGGTFFLFYTGTQNVCLATSPDLDRWARHASNPVLKPDGQTYDLANFRDPFVFFNDEEKCWWMLLGAQLSRPPRQRAGCVALARSKDLLRWTLGSPLWSPKVGPHADCPQLSRMGERWVLTYLQRNTRYRLASSPAGPFRRPPVRNLGTPWCAAGSRPAFDPASQQWISFPFINSNATEDDLAPWGYGGPLGIPRRLQLRPDGALTESPVSPMIEAILAIDPPPAPPLAHAQPLVGRWLYPDLTGARSLDPNGGTLFVPDAPPDLYLEADLTLHTRDMDAHLLLRTDASLQDGYQLSLHPRSGQASLRPISQWDTDRVLASRGLPLKPKQPVKLRVFLAGSVLEVFFGDAWSMTTRLYRHRTGGIAFEARDGRLDVSHIVVRELASR